MSAERVAAVALDARLHRAGPVHSGHTGPCPDHSYGHACWQFEIGLTVERGRVRWLHADTAADAFERAARVLFDGVRIQDVEGYMG